MYRVLPNGSRIEVSINFGDIKNDHSLWGQRCSALNTTIQAHFRPVSDLRAINHYIYYFCNRMLMPS